MSPRKKKEPAVPSTPPIIIDRTPEQQRFALRKAVHYFYDIQRLRLQTNGRLTKGTNLHPADVEHFERRVAELELTEANALDDIRAHLKTIPFYVKVLSGGGVKPNPYKGIGPTMAGVILAEFDITREENVSQMWSYSGLAPIPAVRCKACSGLVVSAATNHEPVSVYQHVSKELGKKCTAGDGLAPSQTFPSGKSMRPTKGEKLPYNKFLKSKLVGVLGDVLLRCNSPWRKFYDDYKQRKVSAGWGTSDMHRHRAAIRYMVKMLLLDIWREWRTFEKLPVREPYAVEYLGKVHHAGETASPNSLARVKDVTSPESPRADQEAERDAEVEAELKRASGE